jgi:hypothetical protein
MIFMIFMVDKSAPTEAAKHHKSEIIPPFLIDRQKNGETDHGCTIKEPVGSFSQDGRPSSHHRAYKGV